MCRAGSGASPSGSRCAGCRVTGLDASPLFLDRARQDAAAAGVDVSFIQGDMRDLPWTQRFDRLVNWFGSFGFFDDDTNRRVLAGFRRALRPGGRLLIDHLHLPGFVRVMRPGSQPFMNVAGERGDDFMIYRQRFNPLSGRIDAERLVMRDGRVSRHPFSVRPAFFPELRDWLLQAGFARVEAYGDAGGPLTMESLKIIVVAHV